MVIFVTVGTHEQPFNRLVKYMDELVESGEIKEDVIMQTGYSTYEPKNCAWQKFYSYQNILKLVDEARIVITHGGPSSFIMPLQIGKTPIVFPRQRKYGEHVNDHQVRFTKEIAERMGTIITVLELDELKESIINYRGLVQGMNGGSISNNARFCKEIENIVDQMFE